MFHSWSCVGLLHHRSGVRLFHSWSRVGLLSWGGIGLFDRCRIGIFNRSGVRLFHRVSRIRLFSRSGRVTLRRLLTRRNFIFLSSWRSRVGLLRPRRRVGLFYRAGIRFFNRSRVGLLHFRDGVGLPWWGCRGWFITRRGSVNGNRIRDGSRVTLLSLVGLLDGIDRIRILDRRSCVGFFGGGISFLSRSRVNVFYSTGIGRIWIGLLGRSFLQWQGWVGFFQRQSRIGLNRVRDRWLMVLISTITFRIIRSFK